MQKQVLFFFPHNPYPPRTGAHKRCLEMLKGLKEIGCEVTFVSSVLCTDNPWQRSSVEALRGNWVKSIELQETTPTQRMMLGGLRKGYRYFLGNPTVNHRLYFSLGLSHWFSTVLRDLAPDTIFMNFAYWDALVDHEQSRSIIRIIETHDLLSLNEQMRQAVDKCLLRRTVSVSEMDERLLQEDFFQRLSPTPSEEEFAILDQYNFTIAISTEEAEIIKRNTKHTQVVHIPMTHEPHYVENNYSGPALFTASPNPFNVQGYYYFAKRVLPLVRRKLPSFSLLVTGSLYYDGFLPGGADGIEFMGFLPDLRATFESSGFFVCPVFGGTGQQVKIVEAMAYGLPVIALRRAAARSPLQHGLNGLVADNAEEFADHVINLWNDRRLCRQLGNAARDTIAAEYSREGLVRDLEELIYE